MSSIPRSLLLRVLLLLTFSTLFVAECFGAETWTSIGPSGGIVRSLAAAPSDPNIVYVGTDGGIFKSTNGGTSWTHVNSGLNAYSNIASTKALAIETYNPDAVYAGVASNIFKTTNGGATWIRVANAKADILTLVVDPSNPSTIYAGLQHDGVLKSDDAGRTWREAWKGLPNLPVLAFAMEPSTTEVVYAGSWEGVFKSTNGGQSWNRSNTGMGPVPVLSLLIHPLIPGLVFAGTLDQGMFGSTNGGNDWRRLSSEKERVHSLALSLDGTLIYAGTLLGVLVSSDAGTTWTKSAKSPLVDVQAVQPGIANSLYIGTGAGVFKSIDAGAAWDPVAAGLNNTDVRAIAIDPTRRKTIYAGDGSNGVFKSVDSGATWTSANNGLASKKVQALAIDPLANTIYAATEGGIYKSINGGSQWTASSSGVIDPSMTSLAIHPSSTNIVYAASAAKGIVFKSTDEGASWSGVSIGVGSTAIHAIRIDPSSPSTLYAAVEKGGVFKSTDDGATWTAVNKGLPAPGGTSNARAIGIDARSGTIFVGNVDGLYKSDNRGAKWTALTGAEGRVVNVEQLALDPSNPKLIYAGTKDRGVFRTSDGGGTWTKLSDGLTTLAINSLAISASKKVTVYLGTWGAGMYRLDTVTPRASTEAPQNPSDRESAPERARHESVDKDPKPQPTTQKSCTCVCRPSVRQIAVRPRDIDALRAIPIPSGQILVVRREGKYAAIQATRQLGASIRYKWWYQPDGSGSFTNTNVLTGQGESAEIYPGPAPTLSVGPFRIEWSKGGPEKGWIYFRHVDNWDIVYDLSLTDATDINEVDTSKIRFLSAHPRAEN